MSQCVLTLVVITLNEQDHLERCLRSVSFADEIIVVDSFSSDRTVEIAQKCGARVVQEKWRGFGPQKAFGVSLAKHDWILSLDADEALSPELALEIQNSFAGLDPQTGYRLPRLSFHLGRWIRYGGWYPDYQLRLFNRKFSGWSDASLHESVQAPAQAKLQSNLYHYVFQDVSDQVRTNDKYSSLGALDLHRRGKKFSYYKLLTKPASKFVETYFWKRGFMDGLAGYIIAVGAAYSVFLRWSKLWELERGPREKE